MGRDWKYILYIALAFGLFIVLKMVSPKAFNWTVTFAPDDKNPYGGYAFDQAVRNHFVTGRIRNSHKTLYELADSITASDNLLVISESFSGDPEDTKSLLRHVAAGGNALISARYFYGKLADTLGVRWNSTYYLTNTTEKSDSTRIRFVHENADTAHRYTFKVDYLREYFSRFDSTKAQVIARNQFDQPVTIRVRWGKGSLMLNTTPMIFTNMLLLDHDCHDLVAKTMSTLPADNIYRTEYYQRGRMEITTPLRFILQTEPLRWAYYITIISLLVFMAFEMKRRQRIIPIVKPLSNATLEFVNTIGALYYQDGHHKGIAEKKINYLLEYIRSHFMMATNQLDAGFVTTLAKKSGKDNNDIELLIHQVNAIRSSPNISEHQLMELNEKIEAFYR